MVGITQMRSAALMNPNAAEEARIMRMRELSRALQDSAMRDEGTQMVSGFAVPQSGLAALAKVLQGVTGAGMGAFADYQDRKLADAVQKRRTAAAESGDVQQMLSSGDPLLQQYALHKADLEAKRAEKEAEAKLPTTSQRDFTWAAGGDEAKAQQAFLESKHDPLKDLALQLQMVNSQNTEAARQRDDARADQEFSFRRQEAATDNARAERNIGLLEADRADRRMEREEARRKAAAERMYKIEMSQWEKENPTYRQDETKLKDAEVNKKKLDDAADNLLSGLKKTTGDNIPNFQVGPINADRARELQNAYQALLWNIRSPEMANTGVLNPGEIPMLEQAIADPTSFKNVGQTEAILKQIDELKKTAQRNYDTMKDVFGKRTPPPKFDPDAEVDLPESYLKDMESSLGAKQSDTPKKGGIRFLGWEK